MQSDWFGTESIANFCRRQAARRYGPLLLLAGIVLLAYGFLQPVYNTNDDVAMRLLLEGRYVPGAAPTEQLYFINLELCRALAWLYGQAPQFYWYDLFELGTLGLAFVVAVRLVVLSGGGNRLAVLCFAAATFLAVVAQPQFTAVAILASGVGLLAASLAVMGKLDAAGPAERFVHAAAGGVLVLLGLLFRLKAGAMALLFVALCLVASVLSGEKPSLSGLRQRAFLLLPVVLCLAVAALAAASHNAFYRGSPAWAEFSRFNALRAADTELLLPRQAGQARPGAIPGSGLSDRDRQALNAHVYFDPDVISVSTLAKDVSATSATRFVDADPIILLRQLAKCLLFLLPVEAAVAGMVLGTSRSGFWRTAAFGSGAMFAIIIVLMLFMKTPPWRITWPMGMLQFIALAGLRPTAIAIGGRNKTAERWLLAAAAAATLMIAITVSAIEEAKSRIAEAELQQPGIGAASAVFSFADGLQVASLERPFHRGPVQRDYKVVFMGVLIRSPIVVQQLLHFSPQPLAKQVCGKSAVVTVGNLIVMRALQNYYYDHKSLRVAFDRRNARTVVDLYACRILGPRT